ncbi:hypothetical protein [Cobetia crustatorum]|uniref:hypothetical protein n=1 Tax=Cobetia crustatorum TaxID=553385 RepID=UPI0004BC263D|nr:hypothetical protein [Cobetia crustatorum]
MTLTVNAPIRQSITNLVTLMLALSVAVMSLLALPAQADEGMDIMDAAREGDNAAIERYHDQGGDLSITESHAIRRSS